MKNCFLYIILLLFCYNNFLYAQTACLNQSTKVLCIDGANDIDISDLMNLVICDGDTIAYNNLMTQIPYYDYFVYSIYMANEYDYPPAYYRAYRIYDLWNKLYNTSIDSISWHYLKFWIEWGSDVGDGACNEILRDSFMLSEQSFVFLDSIDGFTFVIPDSNAFENSVQTTLPGSNITISISKDVFMNHKKQLVCYGDTISAGILERYAGASGYTRNEHFMFRICNQIKYEANKNLIFCVLWYLADIYQTCLINRGERFEKAFNSKLGIKMLLEGYRAGDNYSIISLAKLYAQGVYLQQDTTLAFSLLKQKMSEDAAKRWVKRWMEE